MTAGWLDAPLILWDLAEAISITTFRVRKNNIGKGGLKIFLKGEESKKGGLFEKGGDKYPLQTMCLPDNMSSTIKRIPFNSFNNIKVSLRIIGTSLVTTCTCEWSFSAMRRLKTYTKTTMVSERLYGIALMHVHQEIGPDIEKDIDLFSTKNRRLSFT